MTTQSPPAPTTPKVTSKQREALQIIRDRSARQILYGGAMYTGKSRFIAMTASSLARMHPGTAYGVFRKNRTTLERTTLESFWEHFYENNILEGRDYRFDRQKLVMAFSTPGQPDTKIFFMELDESKDPGFNKVRSLQLTAAFIDEANEVSYDGWVAVNSRVGRKNTDSLGRRIPAFLFGGTNPDDNWVKDEFYTPFKEGSLDRRRAFIPALPTDNEFADPEYLESLEDSPRAFIELYLRGNWDFAADDDSLFKHRFLSRQHIPMIPLPRDQQGYAVQPGRWVGADFAREGTDRVIFSLIEGDQLTVQYQPTIEKDYNGSDDVTDYGSKIADELIAFCETHRVGYEHVAGDEVGNGGTVFDACRRKKFFIRSYKSNSTKDLMTYQDGTPKYDNIRSQSLYELAKAIEKGEFSFYNEVEFWSELKRELIAHGYSVDGKVTKVESKHQIKARLGLSPDLADALSMAYWVKMQTAARAGLGSLVGI